MPSFGGCDGRADNIVKRDGRHCHIRERIDRLAAREGLDPTSDQRVRGIDHFGQTNDERRNPFVQERGFHLRFLTAILALRSASCIRAGVGRIAVEHQIGGKEHDPHAGIRQRPTECQRALHIHPGGEVRLGFTLLNGGHPGAEVGHIATRGRPPVRCQCSKIEMNCSAGRCAA